MQPTARSGKEPTQKGQQQPDNSTVQPDDTNDKRNEIVDQRHVSTALFLREAKLLAQEQSTQKAPYPVGFVFF